MDTVNPLFGRTRHPTHADRASGTSSGGEAALAARSGSPVGLATDLLGCVRFPVAYCGGCSLKPTPGRLSSLEMGFVCEMSRLRYAVCGPMGRRVDDLADVMRTLCCDRMYQLDTSLPYLPFDEDVYVNRTSGRNRCLTIGYYTGIRGLVQPVPAVERAVGVARRRLEAAGHRLVTFTPPTPELILELAMGLFSSSMEPQFREVFYGGWQLDSMDAVQRVSHMIGALPSFLRDCLVSVMRGAMQRLGEPALASVVEGALPRQPVAVMEARCADYSAAFFSAWDKAGLDICLSPVTLAPATRLNTPSAVILPLLPHCAVYSLVGAPAGAVTISTVTQEDETAAVDELSRVAAHLANPSPETANSTDAHTEGLEGDFVDGRAEIEGTAAEWTCWSRRQLLGQQVGSQGLPLAVQVAAKPWQEELVLHILRKLEA